MPLIVVGLNHKTASIDIREKMSIAQGDIDHVVGEICRHKTIHACVIVSTCNRTEFYMSAQSAEDATQAFCNWFGFECNKIDNNLYIKSALACVEHLFYVSSGLDSMVLGEAQILGQVKSSYETSRQLKKLDNSLDRLFQSAFHVAKSVRSDTDIGKSPVSVANSAVQLSKQIIGDLSQQNVLMIGAGATAELLLRYVNKHPVNKLSVCNRSIENAKTLATQFNCESFDLGNLSNKIAEFDLIFTATSSKTPIIDLAMIKQALKQRKQRPMVIIDIAIPRDVDIGIKKFNDVFYYSVDDLQKVINKNLANRQESAKIAQGIIQVEAEGFYYWLKGQQHTQLIHNFQKETAKIRKESLDKALKQLNKGIDAEEVLFYLANNLTKKLNHAPVKAIRGAIQSGDSSKIDTIRELLKLDYHSEKNNDT